VAARRAAQLVLAGAAGPADERVEGTEQDALTVNHFYDIGRPIEVFDVQRAAICRTHDAILATRNMKDFRDYRTRPTGHLARS